MAKLGIGKVQRIIQGGSPTFVNVASNANNQYFGNVAVSSTAAGFTAVVSTAIVNSSSLILSTLVAVGQANSGQTPFIMHVATISTGGFFRLSSTGSIAPVGSYSASWLVVNPKP